MKTLEQLLEENKKIVDAMTPEQKQAMLDKQAEGWMKSEIQWAKDFMAGKCDRD